MGLTRDTSESGLGKYSIIEHEKNDHIEHGLPHSENEFIVIKLKDINSYPALLAYAMSALNNGDEELSDCFIRLSTRAGKNSKWCKKPD